MKTKIKNKTRKKGGHKVRYDYQENIDAGTNRPLTGKYVHKNNCLACAMYSLGYMTERTSRFLQRIRPEGVSHDVVEDMVNETYGPGHKFEIYENEEAVKTYLKPGEATLGYCENGTLEDGRLWGHYFAVFCSKNGNLYAIDSQQHLVMPLSTFLKSYEPTKLHMLSEPTKMHPKYKFIIPEVIKDAIKKEKSRYDYKSYLQYVVHEPVQTKIPSGIQALDDMFPDAQQGSRNQWDDEDS